MYKCQWDGESWLLYLGRINNRYVCQLLSKHVGWTVSRGFRYFGSSFEGCRSLFSVDSERLTIVAVVLTLIMVICFSWSGNRSLIYWILSRNPKSYAVTSSFKDTEEICSFVLSRLRLPLNRTNLRAEGFGDFRNLIWGGSWFIKCVTGRETRRF